MKTSKRASRYLAAAMLLAVLFLVAGVQTMGKRSQDIVYEFGQDVPQPDVVTTLNRDEICELKLTIHLPPGRVLIYTRENDETFYYAAFEGEAGLFDLGRVAHQGLDYGADWVRGPQGYMLRIDRGYRGAHETSLYRLAAYVPKHLVTFLGTAEVIDLDGDGLEEWIITRTPYIRTRVYKWFGDTLRFCDLNSALSSKYVLFVTDNNSQVLSTWRVATPAVVVYEWDEQQDKEVGARVYQWEKDKLRFVGKK